MLALLYADYADAPPVALRAIIKYAAYVDYVDTLWHIRCRHGVARTRG